MSLRFYIFNNQLRVRKPRFSESALHLPHTCGLCRKGEAARFYNMRALKSSRGEENSERKKAYCYRYAFFVGVVLNLGIRRRQLAEKCENKNTNSRKQNRAFSGYARGWFFAIPCRALLASASAPLPYSRKSRFAAIFREIFGFIIINNCAPLFANTFAYGKRVNFLPFIK